MTDRDDPSDQENQEDKESQARHESRRQGAVYQGAFEAVIALLVAALAGYWLDGYFDTTPVLLIIGVVIGFASFTIRLIRLGRWVQGGEAEVNSVVNTESNEESTDPKA